MTTSPAQKEILVCGYPAALRMESLLTQLAGELSLRRVCKKSELLEELSRGQQPICVIEHEVPAIDSMNQIAQLLNIKADDEWAAALARKTQISLSPFVTAYNLLPELISRSPLTRYVITSHTRGSGIAPPQRALYKERAEVLKVMGFVNGDGNTNYLLKLLSRVYLGRTWKPKPVTEG
jgi:hypothetical protein